MALDPSNHPATLIVQRSGQDKVLNVQPSQRGSAGVGIQLQAPPPPQQPPPVQRPMPARPVVARRPAAAPQPPAPQQPPPRVNEEELLDTMAEFANPLKKSSATSKGVGGFDPNEDEFDDDEFEDDDRSKQSEEEDDEDEYDGGQAEFGGGAGGGEFHEEPQQYVEKPSEGYRSLEEEKSDIMFKLQRLQRQGVRGMRTFTPYSDIRDMRTELNRIRTELELERSVKFQRKILMAIVSAMEWGNSKFNPFDLELDGWSEQMHQSVQSNTEYDGIFEELYFKYRGKVSTPPEVRLLLMVGGSAMMFHMTKAMTKSLMPNLGDMMRQNPEMMQNMMKSFSAAEAAGAPAMDEDTQQHHQQQPGTRREMRGPGLDIGGLGGGLGGLMGGLPGMGGISSAGLGGGLGGLMGSLGGGSGNGLTLPPPPPPPTAQLKPQPTRPDRAQPRVQVRDDDDEDRFSDRLSDVLSDDLGSVPDDLQSVRSAGSDTSRAAKKVRISVAPVRRGGAKKQKVSDKKVITI